MMTKPINPRSMLHALAPVGFGTPDVESLASYFCRLAHTHSMTARNLSVWILDHYGERAPDDYKWFRRAFSGPSPESEQWAARLAELTGIERLDRLTLAPWRHLIAGGGLAPKLERWCPCCLEQDMASGGVPYLRLAWDVGQVTACVRHKVALVSSCPHCAKSNIRNRASTVVPGYCTACGGFLGDGTAPAATPEGLWLAGQVGQMLAGPALIGPDDVVPLLKSVIERMAAGKVPAFAKMLGLSRAGVWYWVRKGVLPTLDAWLNICLHGGIALDRLFSGSIQDWALPVEPPQLPIPVLASARKGLKPHELDWKLIRLQLRDILDEAAPISLAQACSRLGIEYKQAYQRANTEARAIVDRFLRHRSAVRQVRKEQFSGHMDALLRDRLNAGFEGISARDVWPTLTGDLRLVRHVFQHIGSAAAAND